MNKTLKTGACSVVLGDYYYGNFITPKKNKLIKIVKKSKLHDEFKNLTLVRQIPNYDKYYSIPDEISLLIRPSDLFYEHVKQLALTEDPELNIFGNNLNCHFLDIAGHQDLLESIDQIDPNNSFWKNYRCMVNCAKQILLGLSFLHKSKIAHLDIKPENIMVNEKTATFKIIDFGFSQIEPFKQFILYPRGTPGYFPQQFKIFEDTEWLPKIKANDMDNVMGGLRMATNYKYVYKIDAYCLGRVLYFLRYIFNSRIQPSCFSFDSNSRSKLNSLIKLLLEPDVRLRPYIIDLAKNFH